MYPLLAQTNADFPWTEVMEQLRQIWLTEGGEDEARRTSRKLANLLGTSDVSLSAWCSHSKSRRKPPEWAVARMLHLTGRVLCMSGEKVRLTRAEVESS